TGPASASGNTGKLEQLPEYQTDPPYVSLTTDPGQENVPRTGPFVTTLPAFIFSGVLLGLLPMWISGVFIAAAAILGLLFILCPQRLQMIALAVTAGLFGLAQMLWLSAASGRHH